jgi:hypothetical protein
MLVNTMYICHFEVAANVNPFYPRWMEWQCFLTLFLLKWMYSGNASLPYFNHFEVAVLFNFILAQVNGEIVHVNPILAMVE